MSDKALLISLLDLPPQLGERAESSLLWTVPEGWRTNVLGLEPGGVIPLAVELTTIDDGVLVQVRAVSDEATELRGECVRCLDPVSIPWHVDASEFYEEQNSGGKTRKKRQSDEGIESEGDELDQVLRVENNQVNIEPLLRDAILAAAPLLPLCSRNCRGLCAQCGLRLAELEPDHHHEFLDPRFAALEGFFPESGEETDE